MARFMVHAAVAVLFAVALLLTSCTKAEQPDRLFGPSYDPSEDAHRTDDPGYMARNVPGDFLGIGKALDSHFDDSSAGWSFTGRSLSRRISRDWARLWGLE